jgi:hypothetical protein
MEFGEVILGDRLSRENIISQAGRSLREIIARLNSHKSSACVNAWEFTVVRLLGLSSCQYFSPYLTPDTATSEKDAQMSETMIKNRNLLNPHLFEPVDRGRIFVITLFLF